MKTSVIKITVLALPLLLGACATKKVANEGKTTITTNKQQQSEAVKKLTFVQKVAECGVRQEHLFKNRLHH